MRLGALCACFLAFAAPAFAGQGVGSGGDYLQILFEQARREAASVIPRLNRKGFQGSSYGEILSDEDVRFILENKLTIADDIRSSPHIWSDQLPPGLCPSHTCACTVPESQSAVYFSFDNCRQAVDTIAKAARLLVHETMHHMNVVDENAATRMALGAYAAWETLGGTDSPHWNRISRSIAPVGRLKSLVWSGREAIVWGGFKFRSEHDQKNVQAGDYGGRYNPQSDTWVAINKIGQPEERYEHVAVWTGDAMFIWGGRSSPETFPMQVFGGGALYFPLSDSWREVPEKNAPSGRIKASAVMADHEVLVWGGQELAAGNIHPPLSNSGSRFNLVTGEWNPITVVGAPSPRYLHSVVWTGQEMIVWGGVNKNGEALADGALYRPATDRWETLGTVGAPVPAVGQVAVWLGDHMAVFARNRPGARGGAIYRRSDKRWLPMNTTNAPMGRASQIAIWTGLQLVLYDASDSGEGDNISIYDPYHDSWSTPRSYSPTGLVSPAIVWSGLEAIVVGANPRDNTIGGMFYP